MFLENHDKLKYPVREIAFKKIYSLKTRHKNKEKKKNRFARKGRKLLKIRCASELRKSTSKLRKATKPRNSCYFKKNHTLKYLEQSNE